MATDKPKIINSTWANVVNNYSPGDPEYDDIIERPPQDKIEAGWEWGEKPSHKWFNYGWKSIDEFTHHVNSNGIPVWDAETVYEKGSIVLYSPYLYKATLQNQNSAPDGTNNPDWEMLGHTLKDLTDTWDDATNPIPDDDKYRLLVFNSTSNLWEPKLLDDVIAETKLGDLTDVSLKDTINSTDILAYDEPNKYWTNMSINDAILRDVVSTFTIAQGIQYKTPDEYNVLKYDGNIWKIQPNVMEKTQWYKILNPPSRFIPPTAARDVLGGAKVYALGETLYIETAPQSAPGRPESLGAISEPSKIELFWLPSQDGERSSYYNVYRDSNLLRTGVYDNYYEDTDVDKDKEYIYHVVGINTHGESPESNRTVGHTYSEPSKPQNLDYKIVANNVELFWETPEIVSGELTYTIYRNNIEIGTTTELTYTDTNVATGSYTYFVNAKNKYFSSENSNTILVVKA
jgi:hypothetical protein